MPRTYWLLGVFCLWCATGFAQDVKNEQTLFESAFGQRKARVNQRISVPLVLDQRELGLVEVDLGAKPIRLSVKSITPLLKGVLKPEVILNLERVQNGGWINLDELSKLGIATEYSTQKIALEVALDLPLRAEKTIEIDQRRTHSGEGMLPTVEPEKYSLILNTRVVQSWQQSNLSPTIQRGRIFTDWAGRAGDWVTEVSGSFATDASGGGFNRSDSKLIRDWSDVAIRLTLGDALSAPRGALASQVLGGIRLTRQFSINPKINNLSQPSDRLSLATAAAVDVDVNGFLVRTLRLDPGVYNLKDIYAFQGANDILIRVVEPGGRVVVKRFDYFFDSTLLAPGLHEWDLALGTPSSAVQTGRRYEGSEKAGSGWWRKGWSSSMTAGMGLQAINRLGVQSRALQAEGTWTNQWGAWTGWLASSSREVTTNAELNGRGLAQMLQWRMQTSHRPQSAWSGNLTIQATHAGKQYTSVESLSPAFASTDFGIRAGLAWDKNWSASLAVSRRASDAPSLQNRAMTFGVRRQIDKEWNVDSTLGQSQNAGIWQNFFTIALRYSPFILNGVSDRSEDNTTWRAGSSYQSIDHRWQNDVEVVGTNPARDATWRINGTRTQNNAGDETTVRSRIQASRAESTWTTVQTRDRVQGASAYHEWTLSNAVVMSRAGIKLSSPVYDSAVVFRPREGFEPYKLLVDPQSDRAAATSDRWGTPVLTNVASYHAREMQLDLENLPPAMSLGHDRWLLFPTYRSVLEVPVGSDANTQLSGTLTNMAGDPMVLQSLRVLALSQSAGRFEPIELFTNRKGQFMTPSLSPGQYQIVRQLDDAMLYQFEILPTQSGVRAIGNLKVKD